MMIKSLGCQIGALNTTIHRQYRHAGPRSGISCFYQREEISLR